MSFSWYFHPKRLTISALNRRDTNQLKLHNILNTELRRTDNVVTSSLTFTTVLEGNWIVEKCGPAFKSE